MPADCDMVVAYFPCSEALFGFCFNPLLPLGAGLWTTHLDVAKTVLKKALKYDCVLTTPLKTHGQV